VVHLPSLVEKRFGCGSAALGLCVYIIAAGFVSEITIAPA
jgi:hypothetical protein